MGDMAEDFLDGTCCSLCGEYFLDPNNFETLYSHDYEVVCKACWEELSEDERSYRKKAKVRTEAELTTERYFILVDKEPRQVTSFEEFNEWMKNNDVCVAYNEIPDGSEISTIFTGHDMECSEEPLLFETTIYKDDQNCYEERYATWTQAELGHKKAIGLAERTSKK